MNLLTVILFAFLLVLSCSYVVKADSFRAPVKIVATSKNGDYIVRIQPNESLSSDLIAHIFKFTADGKYVKALDVALLNHKLPREIFITNKGSLVTIDGWYESGGENSVVVYSEKGQFLKRYALEDIYSLDEISKFLKTTSSRHWHCSLVGNVSRQDYSVVIVDSFHRVINIDGRDGTLFLDKNFKIDCPYFLGAPNLQLNVKSKNE